MTGQHEDWVRKGDDITVSEDVQFYEQIKTNSNDRTMIAAY